MGEYFLAGCKLWVPLKFLLTGFRMYMLLAHTIYRYNMQYAGTIPSDVWCNTFPITFRLVQMYAAARHSTQANKIQDGKAE